MEKKIRELEEQIEILQSQVRELKDSLSCTIWELHKIKVGAEDEKV